MRRCFALFLAVCLQVNGFPSALWALQAPSVGRPLQRQALRLPSLNPPLIQASGTSAFVGLPAFSWRTGGPLESQAAAPVAATADVTLAQRLESMARAALSVKERPASAAARSGEAAAASENQLWHGSPRRGDDRVAAAPASATRRSSLLTKAGIRQRAASTLGAAAIPLMTASPAAEGLNEAIAKYGRYAGGAAILGATYFIAARVAKAIRAAGKRGDLNDRQTAVLRVVSAITIWGLGISGVIAVFGESAVAFIVSLGISGITLTMVAKYFLGDMLEGFKVLFNRPFKIGDKIMIGAEQSEVVDFTLTSIIRQPQGEKAAPIKYTLLSSLPIWIATPYDPHRRGLKSGPKVGAKSFFAAVAHTVEKFNYLRATMWLALGAAAILGTVWLNDKTELPFIQTALPWLQVGAIAFTARQVEKWVTRIIVTIMTQAGRSRQAVAIARLITQVCVYLAGTSAGLFLLDVTWPDLLKALGATTIAITWATSDVIIHVIQYFDILLASKPFHIGSVIEVGGITGKVIDMTLQFVVLEHSDHSHSLIPYPFIRGKVVSVLDATADASPPKPAAVKS